MTQTRSENVNWGTSAARDFMSASTHTEPNTHQAPSTPEQSASAATSMDKKDDFPWVRYNLFDDAIFECGNDQRESIQDQMRQFGLKVKKRHADHEDGQSIVHPHRRGKNVPHESLCLLDMKYEPIPREEQLQDEDTFVSSIPRQRGWLDGDVRYIFVQLVGRTTELFLLLSAS